MALIWSNSQFISQFAVVEENRCAFGGILNRPGRVSLRKAFFNKGFKLAHPHIILIYLLPYLLACLLTYWLIFVLVKSWFVKNLYCHHESVPKFCRDCGLKGTHIKTQNTCKKRKKKCHRHISLMCAKFTTAGNHIWAQCVTSLAKTSRIYICSLKITGFHLSEMRIIIYIQSSYGNL